ncbi:MAG: hypothetical protein JWQ50_8129 [Caballeronia mineralivorans]|jgi:hypothetical protein|nr:hypothetical protein [Caballeronia mineralivorans]
MERPATCEVHVRAWGLGVSDWAIKTHRGDSHFSITSRPAHYAERSMFVAKIIPFPSPARDERDRAAPANATGPQPAKSDKRKPAKKRQRGWLWRGVSTS